MRQCVSDLDPLATQWSCHERSLVSTHSSYGASPNKMLCCEGVDDILLWRSVLWLADIAHTETSERQSRLNAPSNSLRRTLKVTVSQWGAPETYKSDLDTIRCKLWDPSLTMISRYHRVFQQTTTRKSWPQLPSLQTQMYGRAQRRKRQRFTDNRTAIEH